MPQIHFFNEEVPFRLKQKRALRSWVENITASSNKSLQAINYIFCTDNYLLELNRNYLDHDTLTDIITFDNSHQEDVIEADIFISIDRVKGNSADQKMPFEKELHRVMIHGVLHLLGYSDKTKAEKTLIREKEDACLSLLPI